MLPESIPTGGEGSVEIQQLVELEITTRR